MNASTIEKRRQKARKLGLSAPRNGRVYQGYISKCRIYNRALTPPEVATLLNES